MNLSLHRPSSVALNPVSALRMLLSTAAVAIAAASMAQPAVAQPMDSPSGWHHERMQRGGGTGAGVGLSSRMLDWVDATPDQRTRIKAILAAAHADLKAQHTNRQALHEQMQALLAQPVIDARGAETLRQQMLALHDATSKRKLQAALDTANVLTPEQRKTLAAAIAKHQTMMRRHAAERAASDGGRK